MSGCLASCVAASWIETHGKQLHLCQRQARGSLRSGNLEAEEGDQLQFRNCQESTMFWQITEIIR